MDPFEYQNKKLQVKTENKRFAKLLPQKIDWSKSIRDIQPYPYPVKPGVYFNPATKEYYDIMADV